MQFFPVEKKTLRKVPNAINKHIPKAQWVVVVVVAVVALSVAIAIAVAVAAAVVYALLMVPFIKCSS